MKVFTSHVRPGGEPVMVREGFSWAAFFFGFLFLAAHRAWIQAALNLAALLLIVALDRALASGAPMLGLALLQGLFGRDLWRWSLAQRGFRTGPVVVAPNEDEAFAKLLGARADFLPSGAG
jgi:hypothetical protein